MNNLLNLFKQFTITEEYPQKGYLSEVHSPSRLFFQTDDEELMKLDRDMNEYYDSNQFLKVLEISQKKVFIGMKIATYICGSWHRATVLSDVKQDGNVCIFAHDFGTKGYVNLKFCRYLADDFIKIPRKSIRACLHGIMPPNNSKLFDMKATDCIIHFCYNKIFGIKIVTHHKEADFYEIIAKRDDGAILNDYLVTKGFARPISENTKFSVHYPPFDLLEKSPFYETFGHRYSYLNRGIDFNAFENEVVDPNYPYEEQLIAALKNERFAAIKNVFESLHSVSI